MGNLLLEWGHDEVAAALGKDAAWHERRRKGLGGSDARVIMSGDDQALIHLWQEKRGERVPEDLSDVIPVQFGSWTEPLNRYFYTLRTGRFIDSAGVHVSHREHAFIAANLDGLTTTADGKRAVYEAKTVNPFNFDMDNLVAKYMPQMQHQMMVCDIDFAVLSVLVGTMRWEFREVEACLFFQSEMLERELAFWSCVKNGTPPAALPPIEVPVTGAALRTVSMAQSNSWGNAAFDWLGNRLEAACFSAAEKTLKDLVEPDVGVAIGHGIEIRRDKANRLRIRAEK